MESKTVTLQKLQDLDLALDAIHKEKGALPEDINYLVEALKNLETVKNSKKEEVANKEAAIELLQEEKKNAEELIKKSRDEQLSASDSLSYDTITKEIALQELEMQLAQKKIKENQYSIKETKEETTTVRAEIREKKEQLKDNKKKLSEIQEKVEEKENKLKEERPKIVESVDKKLYEMYEEMRQHLVPSCVITVVKEDACQGCWYCIPPHQQTLILEKKKMIQCEHCNRILVDVIEEEEKPKKKK